jgi:hypothetical protein
MTIKKEIKQHKKEIDERKKQLDAADASEKAIRESADYPCKNCGDAFYRRLGFIIIWPREMIPG